MREDIYTNATYFVVLPRTAHHPFVTLPFPPFIYQVLYFLNDNAYCTAGTSSSSLKIGGSGPTGVILKGLIYVLLASSHTNNAPPLILELT